MRDAIVYGYEWAGGTGPVERIALAFARRGAKVLHCGAAASALKRPDTALHEVEPNVHSFKPQVLASRLHRLPGMSRLQGGAVARQILGHARSLGLRDPVFIYGRLGFLVSPLCAAMKAHGCLLVHLCTDPFQGLEEEYIGKSDLTVVFSRTELHRLRARWDEKIRYAFFGIDLLPFRGLRQSPESPPEILAGVPRPRLGYSGGFADEFVNARVLRELLERRRDWSFISFGWKPENFAIKPAVPLPNAYVLPWQTPGQLARCVAAFDVGFMPYDCSGIVRLNGAPMKVWDYFALGMPVVATPVIHLWEYERLVYLGENARELEAAVEKALAEPADSPLREERRQVAERHSIEALGTLLEEFLA